MPARFANADTIAAAYLDDQTPTGLFRAVTSRGFGEAFWIIESETQRQAVLLGGDGPHRWTTWDLAAGATAWRGIALGPVELQLEVEEGAPDTGGWPGLGDVQVSPAGVFLTCSGAGRMDVRGLRIGDSAATGSGPEMVFKHWRLIQREPDRSPIVLFEREHS